MHTPSTGKVLKVLTGGLAALCFALAGCLFEESDAPPKITLQPVSDTVAYGDTATFVISVKAPPPLTYAWYANGDTIIGAHDSVLKFMARADWDGKQIHCVVKNNNASITSLTATLTLTGLTEWPAADTVITLGAQGAAEGSAVDLDSAAVLTASQVSANGYARLPNVDLVFLYYNSAYTLNSPAAAKDSGAKYDSLFTALYPVTAAADVRLVTARAKPATPQHAKDVYDEGLQERTVKIALGSKFVVKTTGNRYVYVAVNSATGGAAGTAGLSLSVSSFTFP